MLLLCTGHVCVCVCHRFANSFLCVRLLWCAVIWSLFTEKLTPVCTRAPQDRVQLDCCWSKSHTEYTHFFYRFIFIFWSALFSSDYSHNKNSAYIIFISLHNITHHTQTMSEWKCTWPEILKFHIRFESAARVQPFISMFEYKFTSCLLLCISAKSPRIRAFFILV